MDQNETKTKKTTAIWRILGLLLVIVLLSVAAMFLLKPNQPQKARIGAAKPVALPEHQLKVPITIDTGSLVMNAAEINLSFDPKVVEVVKVSKEQSLFAIWITDQPSFSNTKGTLSFAGGVVNPGFKGSGQVGTVTLRSKHALTTSLKFAAGTQILLNDGKGTAVPLELSPIKVDMP